MSYRLQRHEVVEQRPSEFDGKVALKLRAPTWNEVQEILTALGEGKIDTLRTLLDRHLVSIDGLEMDEIGAITTAAQVFDLLPIRKARSFILAIIRAGEPTDAEVGKSLPQSSGDASTPPGTAVPVDAED